MPNILKRPMFRRGGSSNQGITSGLTKRENFAEKGMDDRTKAMIDYIEKRKQESQPTTLQSIGDYLTAFGATAGKAKSLGEALGGAGAGFSALQQQRRATADKYQGLLDQTLLNQIAGMDKGKVTAKMQEAKTLAEAEYSKYPGDTKEEKVKNAYNDILKKLLFPQRAATSFNSLVINKAKTILANGELKTSALANRAAPIAVKIEQDDIKIPGGYIGFIKATKGGVSDIIPQGDGEIAIVNKKKQGYTSAGFKANYTAGQNYIDPITQSVYKYEGGGKFRRVYPTK